MKKLFALLLALVMVLGLAACGQSSAPAPAPAAEPKAEAPAAPAAPAASAELVGVAMPTKDLQRWNQDGENMKAMLEAAGYAVDLQFGANDIATQVSQIENMIANGCKVLVIASIDGDSLGTVLAQAKESSIPVIAYDRLIMNSDAVSYYATFDNWLVGTKQGEFIRDALDLDNAEGPFNIEFITGDPGDNNINFFFDGAMSILQQYLDNGQLVCPSGQTEKAVVATANWATDAAQARFENILSSNYADKNLDAVLASNDSTALGVENALQSSYSGDVYPVITGQDCDIAIMKNLIEGKQAMSVFKDTRTLASKVVEMVDAIMKGEEPPINDTNTYDNGTGIIPSFLCEPVACTVDNYKELLIDSGYYTFEQLGIDGEAAPAETAEEKNLVGVAMPTKDLQRWNQDGEYMKAMLEEAGYEVDLQFGGNDVQTQLSQLENMIANGCKVLVIASIDGSSLGTVLAQAKEANIPVIAYDRLIMDSDAVSYYATFDNWLVGTTQGEFIRDALDLDNAEGPFNIEFITGSPDDNNINYFFDGAMSILQPYLDSGKLVCPSGQTAKLDVATQGWSTELAQSRFENILSSFYGDGTPLHAVLASNDSTALGVENALASSYTNDIYPVITGQDCDIAIMKNLVEGKQAMSVFKDTRTLAARVVTMVDALMKGTEPEVNDTETYNNGVKVVPSYLCGPTACTAENYKEILIDSGYYTEDQIK